MLLILMMRVLPEPRGLVQLMPVEGLELRHRPAEHPAAENRWHWPATGTRTSQARH